MIFSDDDDEYLAKFLESEALSDASDHEEEDKQIIVGDEESKAKKLRVDVVSREDNASASSSLSLLVPCKSAKALSRRIDTGEFSKIPFELFHQILKFLSSEDLVTCSLVCRCLNYVSSDEYLWCRLYCMRWGVTSPSKVRECAWKKLYIQRDEEDMVEFVRNCPPEFKEYYIQMQAAKRSQTPLFSQVTDDRIILDKTVADQVYTYKSSKGLSDKVVVDHVCSGETCSYYHVSNVFVCEKTGHVHVCDDACREVVLDPDNGNLVCTISGHCFDSIVAASETGVFDAEQQGGATDEAEPFMGSGRFARAYLLGYNCVDEKELEDALRSSYCSSFVSRIAGEALGSCNKRLCVTSSDYREVLVICPAPNQVTLQKLVICSAIFSLLCNCI